MTSDRTVDTGRIKAALAGKAQRLFYGPRDDGTDRAALTLISQVDQAHLVMLVEQKIIPADRGAALLRAVGEMATSGFAAVLSRPRPRGLYLAYEQAISEQCGPDLGGMLHTARSRNDLNATTTMLALRQQGLALVAEGCRLLTAMLATAARHLDTVMPIHTHFQPAMPITFGYYLTGVALAAHRELDRIAHALRSLRRCPLGAHAVAGTNLEIDTARTAALLGFESGPLHAIDVIASRDSARDILGSAAGLAVLISRLATDLQVWSTVEFGYVQFPDWLVGSSSAMPQKRNAFLLEHLKARPAQVVAAWVGSVVATASTPFTNSIEVGTEAVGPVGPALRCTRELLALCALVIGGAKPRPETARAAATSGFVDATALANELVRQAVPFREAHERIGAAVLDALDGGGAWPPAGLDRIDVSTAVDDARFGGGPGSRGEALAAAWSLRHQLRRDVDQLRTVQEQAADQLRRAVEAVGRG
jgi:argininosuccinate lyase